MTTQFSPAASPFRVRAADWSRYAAGMQALRRAVFVEEQGVPETLEWDGRDPQCLHAVAIDDAGTIVGCGRLLPDGHIGRLAVARAWRGRGVGAALLEALVATARTQGHAHVALNAQTHALAFYLRHGFAPDGAPFMEAGIPHQAMERPLG